MTDRGSERRPKHLASGSFVLQKNTSFVAGRIHTSADVPGCPNGYPLRMKKAVEVLIITRSAVLQQGLGALIESLPGSLTVKAIKELTDAYLWIDSHRPDLVLLDIALPGSDVRPVLEKFRAISPEMPRVLLVDHVEDVRWLPQYAEAIVIKGEAPSAVAAIVINLLFSKGEEHEHSDSNP